jgi:hypothetical protein
MMKKRGKKGCQCKDGTYSKECCDGQAQGVGATIGQSTSTVVNTSAQVVKNTTNG